MRGPVPARNLLCIESDFLIKRATQAMKRPAFRHVPDTVWIHNKSTIMCAHQSLCPYVTSLAIDLNLGDLGYNGLATERISDATTGKNVPLNDGLGRRPRIPAVGLRSGFENCDGTCTPESRVLFCVGL